MHSSLDCPENVLPTV